MKGTTPAMYRESFKAFPFRALVMQLVEEDPTAPKEELLKRFMEETAKDTPESKAFNASCRRYSFWNTIDAALAVYRDELSGKMSGSTTETKTRERDDRVGRKARVLSEGLLRKVAEDIGKTNNVFGLLMPNGKELGFCTLGEMVALSRGMAKVFGAYLPTYGEEALVRSVLDERALKEKLSREVVRL